MGMEITNPSRNESEIQVKGMETADGHRRGGRQDGWKVWIPLDVRLIIVEKIPCRQSRPEWELKLRWEKWNGVSDLRLLENFRPEFPLTPLAFHIFLWLTGLDERDKVQSKIFPDRVADVFCPLVAVGAVKGSLFDGLCFMAGAKDEKHIGFAFQLL